MIKELIDEIEDSIKIIVTHRLFTINKEKYSIIYFVINI